MSLGVNVRVFDRPIECPAGRKIGETSEARGPGCYCTITRTVVAAHTDPSSLAKFCLTDHQSCPVWRADRDAFWEKRKRDFDRDLAA